MLCSASSLNEQVIVSSHWLLIWGWVWGQRGGTLRRTQKHTNSLPNVGEIRCYDENGNIFQVNVYAPKWRFLPGYVKTTETADQLKYQVVGWKILYLIKKKKPTLQIVTQVVIV